MKNKILSINKIFIKKILYSAIVQVLFIMIAFSLIKVTYKDEQVKNISENLLITDSFKSDELIHYALIKNNYALELALYNIEAEKQLDSINFVSTINNLNNLKNCTTYNSNFKVCENSVGNFTGISPLKFDGKLIGYILAQKKYTLLNSSSILHDVFLVLLTIIGSFLFNLIFLFLSVKKRVSRNTENLVKIVSDHDDAKQLSNHLNIKEYQEIAKKFIEKKDQIIELEKKKQLAEAVAQVAHDIRSPLTTIEVMVNQFNNQLPESERLMLRNAVRRIDDIAYQLVRKYKGQVVQEGYDNLVFLYLSMLEIISEKRVEHGNKGISIEVTVKDNSSYFAMTLGNITECKRMLSNLINNSVNALKSGGHIDISLVSVSGYCMIKIVDNGCGIPADKLIQLQSENPDENSGIGLGLTHAWKYLKTVDGSLQIESEIDKGTSVTVKVPCCKKPEWLCDEIMFSEDCTLLISDDDPSIHDAWRQKVRQEIEENQHTPIKMVHFNSPEECLAWIENNPDNNVVLFSDYEYLNSSMNGLQLLKSITQPIRHKKLVTSHYENEQIISALTDGIKLLPKQLVHAIKFNVLPVDAYEGEYDLIFIDDQEYNRKMWQNFARIKGIKIKTYASTDDFEIDKADIPFSTAIYIDQDLGEGMETGVEFSKRLHEEGFNNLYLATGYILETNYAWLRGVTNKKPPFME